MQTILDIIRNNQDINFEKLLNQHGQHLTNEDKQTIINAIRNRPPQCSNKKTKTKNYETDLLFTNQLYFLTRGEYIYCFGYDDIIEILKTKQNPFTGETFPDSELQKMAEWKNNYRTSRLPSDILITKIKKKKGAKPGEKLWTKYKSELIRRFNEDDKDLSLNSLPQQFIDSDPTSKKEYIEWIIKSYIDEGIKKVEDLMSRVRPSLKLYERFLKKEHHINDYCGIVGCRGKPGLEEAVEPYIEKGEKRVKPDEYREIYNGKDIRVIVPLTENAACYYGQGTKWCTAARNDNMFSRYNEKGKLYIVIPKNPSRVGEKYQFHFETGSQMNEEDDHVSLVYLFRKYPELNDVFSDKTFNIVIHYGQSELLLNYIKYINNFTIRVVHFSDKIYNIIVDNDLFKKVTDVTIRGYQTKYMNNIDKFINVESIKLYQFRDLDLSKVKTLTRGLHNLKSLTLKDTVIQEDTFVKENFKYLHNLEHFTIDSERSLDAIPPDVFDYLIHLQTMKLSTMYGITEFPPTMFNKLTKLKELYLLSMYEMKTLPARIFDNLAELRVLHLGPFKQETIADTKVDFPHDIFKNLIKLEELVLIGISEDSIENTELREDVKKRFQPA